VAFNDPLKFIGIKKAIQETYTIFITTSYLSSNIYFLKSLKHDFLVWAMIACGFFYFLNKYFATNFKRVFLGVSFLLPLIFLTFYRNTFPYFYLFIMSPPIIFTGFFIFPLKNRMFAFKSKISDITICLILIAIFLSNISNFKLGYNRDNFYEKQLVDIVHRIYPEPVSYIDGCSMISSFNKVGLFTSSAGMEAYLRQNTPIFREILISKVCNLLIANTEVLDFSKTWSEAVSIRGHSLLKDDWEVLNDNFIQHWGLIYVPGKIFEFNNITLIKEFEILIPGVYTIESEYLVTIDDLNYVPGSTINLARGLHKITSLLSNHVLLRFGNNLYKPNLTPFTLEYIHSRFG
jgi:hypothetical protein